MSKKNLEIKKKENFEKKMSLSFPKTNHFLTVYTNKIGIR